MNPQGWSRLSVTNTQPSPHRQPSPSCQIPSPGSLPLPIWYLLYFPYFLSSCSTVTIPTPWPPRWTANQDFRLSTKCSLHCPHLCIYFQGPVNSSSELTLNLPGDAGEVIWPQSGFFSEHRDHYRAQARKRLSCHASSSEMFMVFLW